MLSKNNSFDYQLVFPPLIPNTLPTPSPQSCLLPYFSGVPMYAPALKLTTEEINQTIPPNSSGVYIVLLWISAHNLLVPVYVGSGNIKHRLTTHFRSCERYKLNIIDHYSSEYNVNPKWFYELLKVAETHCFMFTWFKCLDYKIYENEIYHVLKDTSFLLNARAAKKDKRSSRKNQSKKASENFHLLRELLHQSM